MDRRQFLRGLTAFGAAAALLMFGVGMASTAHPAPDSPSCRPSALVAETCPQITPEIVEDAVKLHGNDGRPGSDSPRSKPGNVSQQPGGPAPAPEKDWDNAGRGPANFAAPIPEAPPLPCQPAGACVPAERPVTLEDLASFVPVPGVAHMEPTGWSVAGLPTNFWIETGTHVREGQLFGQAASVRFIPTEAHYNYGDGSPTVRTPFGSSWEGGGNAEFSFTSTSHTYAATGIYTISVGVDFTVEYSYDGSEWIPVEGTLVSTSPPLTAQIVRASTVLVNSDCAANPDGIGC